VAVVAATVRKATQMMRGVPEVPTAETVETVRAPVEQPVRVRANPEGVVQQAPMRLAAAGEAPVATEAVVERTGAQSTTMILAEAVEQAPRVEEPTSEPTRVLVISSLRSLADSPWLEKTRARR